MAGAAGGAVTMAASVGSEPWFRLPAAIEDGCTTGAVVAVVVSWFSVPAPAVPEASTPASADEDGGGDGVWLAAGPDRSLTSAEVESVEVEPRAESAAGRCGAGLGVESIETSGWFGAYKSFVGFDPPGFPSPSTSPTGRATGELEPCAAPGAASAPASWGGTACPRPAGRAEPAT
jgi:hypothetical protein